jgi:nucleoside-diphosphate-sugar epimerase
MNEWVILGCGYVGTRLARALLADGVKVKVCARHTDRLAELGALGATVQAVDAAKLRAFGPVLYRTQSPVVVYSIPPVPNMPAGEPVHRASEAALGVGAQRFIYLSSTAIYGATPDGETVDEDTPVALSDVDAMPRVADESAVETARMAGLPTAILRLAAIYGPGRGVRERIKAGSYKLIDNGEHYFSRVHVDDVVGILRAVATRAPSGGLYCVADERSTTQREYAEWLSARMGLSLPPSVPSLEPGARPRPVRNRKVSSVRLVRELDYRFRYPSYVEGELAIEREAAGQATTPQTPSAVAAPAVTPSAEAGPAVTPPAEAGPAVTPPSKALPSEPVAPPTSPAPSAHHIELTGGLSRHAVARIELVPGARAPLLAMRGEAFVYVLEGAVMLTVGGAPRLASAGELVPLPVGETVVQNHTLGLSRLLTVGER